MSASKAGSVALAAVLAAAVATASGSAQKPNQMRTSPPQRNQMQANQGHQNQTDGDPWAAPRHEMVEQQIRDRGVRQADVLRAMESVPRHLFVPADSREQAYGDAPLPIGWGQTISQPYVVALMTELLELDRHDKVLEIGTGSGYHAAVLSKVAGEVYTIEIIDQLGKQAKSTLQQLGYQNVHVRVGDGYKGWPEEAPFDAIILTAAPPKIPQPLLDQLKPGGRMVVPVGSFVQDLLLLTKTPQGIVQRTVAPVRFVPMTGEVQKKNPGGG
ncbi:MAG TPA: protein-L-isoaspartate(D-aspartate) O-methyltransferase [Thermoanaerobaculia bacterium]|nr:protein-L-isoaspartate(D-aspartate) O-methyltransferase [Thermoanaerobaculia bacterium]